MTYKAALDADARIAAQNALKILAALRQTFDAKAAYERYLTTQPAKSDNPAQDRARARSWAILNVTPNMQALNTVMQRVLAEGYVTGELFADEQLRIATELKKADDTYVDWANWKPGDRAAALLLRPPKAFQQLLESQGIALKEMSQTTTRDIGNAIADAVDLGLSADRSAKNIMRHVANPARALSIAITEQNRAISYATVNRYKEAGLEKMEWEVSSPCDKCARNANAVVPIGAPFPTGATQPPQHPHCRCVLLPVIPDFDDPAITGGTVSAPTITPDGAITNQPFVPGQAGPQEWKPVSEDRWIERQEALRLQRGLPPANDYHLRIMRDQVADAQAIYERGPHAIMLDKGVKTVTEEHLKAVMRNFDIAYEKLPEWRRFYPDGTPRGYTLIINTHSPKAGTLAYTYLGHDSIWISPKDAASSLADIKDFGSWFMPAASTTNENLYTLMHELGHTVDYIDNDALRGKVRSKLIRKYKDLFSRYGRSSQTETYAEVFAQWGLGEQTPVTEAYAEAFGWNLSASEYYEQIPEALQWKPNYRTPGTV